MHREWISASCVEAIACVDKFQLCHRAGARSAVAGSLEAFASTPEEWGGRLLDRRPLDEPPFDVVEAAPAITFTFEGLLIDARAHALLAAGADAGGLYRRAYAGGLAPALVFGLAAARTALTETPAAVGR